MPSQSARRSAPQSEHGLTRTARVVRLASGMVESTTEYDWHELPNDVRASVLLAAADLFDYLEGPRVAVLPAEVLTYGDLDLTPVVDEVKLHPTTLDAIRRAAQQPFDPWPANP